MKFCFITANETRIQTNFVGEAATSTQVREEELPESEGNEVQSDSPLRVIHSHQQHLANYIRICMEEGEKLILGEDRAAPLITEVYFSFYVPCD